MLEDDRTALPLIDSPRDIQQAGAVCLRRTKTGDLRVLLVGSRRSGRWGLPKGHIETNETPRAAAEREAFEEAGVRGTTVEASIGSFTYTKDSHHRRYHVTVYVLDTLSVSKTYPEMTVRKKRWFSVRAAVESADHAELRAILQKLI